MANLFPCPNPACSYQFDPSRIPPGMTSLACPQCDTRFTYRAAPRPAAPSPYARSMGAPQAPAPAPAPPPAAAPYPAAPAAPYPQEAPPPEGPFAGEPPPPRPRPGGRVVTSHYRPQGGARHTIIVVTLFTVFLAAALVAVYFTVRKNPFNRDLPQGPETSAELNFSFDPPKEKWEKDNAARDRLQANVVALKRSAPDAWVALAAQDFKDHNPRPAELRAAMMDRLKKAFDNLEFEDHSAGRTWAGEPAIYYAFRGDVDGELMSGECTAIGHRGVGYWFFAWAPTNAVDSNLTAEFKSLRDRFRLLDYRNDWAETKPPVRTFAAPGGAYRVQDGLGIWKERKPPPEDANPSKIDPRLAIDPASLDPHATLAFYARYPIKNPRSKGIDFVPDAQALVLELDPAGGDPLAAARAYVESRVQARNPEGKTTFEEVKQSPSDAGPEPGVNYVRLRTKDGVDAGKSDYHVITALPVGDKLVVAWAECRWSSARFMEPAMLQLTGSLREGGR